MSFRRLIQILCLVVFLFSLASVASLILPLSNPDLFLRFDPVIFIGTVISGRTFSFVYIPAIIVILLAPFFGRIFCGYICPMGTTIDETDRLINSPGKKTVQIDRHLRSIKYYVLFFILGAALLGVSFVFLGSPISLIARFYGLVIYPMLSFLASLGVQIVMPLAEKFDIYSIVFAKIPTPRFATQLFILVFFIAIFAAVRISPRFWCRFICPSGAILALFSMRPLYRRQVSEDCTNCGKCVKSCPTAAISQDDPGSSSHSECIVCKTCEEICPVDAVRFSAEKADRNPAGEPVNSPERRRFLVSGLAGFGTATVNLTGLNSLYGKQGIGQVAPHDLLRPPGSIPEMDFLAKCVRCGECMVACPNNVLQPIWTQAGFAAIFSPGFVPRRGKCDPSCTNCGDVCPTFAIRSLPRKERIWARSGTATIIKNLCLAWEHKKKCMVCDEVCPFGAIEFNYVEGNPVSVPEITEDKCAGCGYCEHHCPVQNKAAIIVTPMGGLRMAEGSFKEEGMKLGMNISIKPKDETGYPSDEDPSYGTAPGFDADFSESAELGFDDPYSDVDEPEDGQAPGFDVE